jgi:hypothetical protein
MNAHSLSQIRLGARWDLLLKRAKFCTATGAFNIHIVIAIFGRSLISPQECSGITRCRHAVRRTNHWLFANVSAANTHVYQPHVDLYRRSSQQLHASDFPPGRRTLAKEEFRQRPGRRHVHSGADIGSLD